MTDIPNHGRRLSEDEYQRSIVSLYSDIQTNNPRDQQQLIRRKELDLTIDFRLGVDFPQERREALWSVQQSIEKRRIFLMAGWLLRKLFSNLLNQQSKSMADYIVNQYSKVLTSSEMCAFFGEDFQDQ